MSPYPFSKLPALSGKEAVKAFQKLGWTVDRYHGDHAIMVKDGEEAILTVPQHPELKKATLKNILLAGGIRLDEFKSVL